MTTAPVPDHNHWLQTHAGLALDLLNPQPEQIDLADVAVALCRIPRFGGHTSVPYSVAQHSLVVAAILQAQGCPAQVVLQGILHDAPEAYLGDMPTPLKRLLKDYREVEERVWQTVALRFGMPGTLAPEVKQADQLALNAEAHLLLPGGPLNRWAGEKTPLPQKALALLQYPYHRHSNQDDLYSHFIQSTEKLQSQMEQQAQ